MRSNGQRSKASGRPSDWSEYDLSWWRTCWNLQWLEEAGVEAMSSRLEWREKQKRWKDRTKGDMST